MEICGFNKKYIFNWKWCLFIFLKSSRKESKGNKFEMSSFVSQCNKFVILSKLYQMAINNFANINVRMQISIKKKIITNINVN